MRFLRSNPAVIITCGPFYDATDGVPIETGLTITNERITMTADTDAGSAPTNILDNVTGATSGTDNDLNYITNNDAGMMQLELSAANTNRLGRMFLSITDAANHVPVFHEFMVLPAMIYDAFVLGTDVLDASMTQILGTAVSTPATAGVLDINLKNIANEAVSTSTAQLGTNLVNIAGSAVSTSTAQIGVNVVQAGATAWASGAITAASIAADAIGASELAADAAAEIAAAVWKDTTAGDFTTVGSIGKDLFVGGIAPGAAGGHFIAGTNAATGITTALTANVIGNVTGNLSGSVGSVTAGVTVGTGGIAAAAFAAGAIDAAALAADAGTELANALLDLTSGIETNYTVRQALRLILSSAAAKLSGAATTTVTIRDIGDTKNRITATVDADGNRTAITTNVT